MTLRELRVGQSGRVLAVGGERALRHRLLEMGITPYTVVSVKKAAPMGDPIELLIRGYVLTLRLADAEKITVVRMLDQRGERADGRGPRIDLRRGRTEQREERPGQREERLDRRRERPGRRGARAE